MYLPHKHTIDKFKVTKLLCIMLSFYDGWKVCYRKQLTLPHKSFTWRVIFNLFTPSCVRLVAVLWRVGESILRCGWELYNLLNKGQGYELIYWNTFVVFSSIHPMVTVWKSRKELPFFFLFIWSIQHFWNESKRLPYCFKRKWASTKYSPPGLEVNVQYLWNLKNVMTLF